ncbi:hypothetical protein Lser_V15G30642 [Lactuca serriola]
MESFWSFFDPQPQSSSPKIPPCQISPVVKTYLKKLFISHYVALS